MDATHLGMILSHHPVTRRRFRGVFACDELPTDRRTGFYVVNTDYSYGPGEHWVCVEIDTACKYFDSYGLPPMVKEIADYLPEKYKWNEQTLQHQLTTSCGQWCVFYVWKRCQGWRMEDVTECWLKKRLLINDHYMTHLIETEFNTDLEVMDRDFLRSQLNNSMHNYILQNDEKPAVAKLKLHLSQIGEGF